MKQPRSEHLARLEEKIVAIKRELRDDGLASFQRSERELALANAEEALKLFRKAYEFEQNVPD